METIRIGSRKSKLALWQAEYVAQKLQDSGYLTELVLQETKGDKILDVSIAKIGSKGVFTEELEDHLASGHIDIAVHSAKDMQSQLPKGFEIIAFGEREQAHDVIVSDKPVDLNDPSLVLGTSSTRRVALFKHFYPHLKTVDIRGNLQTRIERMRSGTCHAIVLAFAGVHRMGYHDMIRANLDLEQFIPAVGQGSIAIEIHSSLPSDKREAVRHCINDEKSEKCLLAERAFLAKLEGGCSIPVFGLATLEGTDVSLTAGIISLDGSERIIRKAIGQDPLVLGQSLASEILNAGGDKILMEIKNQL